MRSLKQKTVHALYWSMAGSAGKVLAQFFIQVWLARTLGPGPYGEFAALLILMSIGVLLAEGGFGSSLVQRKDVTREDIEYAVGLVLTTSIALSLLLYGNARHVARLLGVDEASADLRIGLCALTIPILAISNISMALLRRSLRNRAIAIISLVGYVAGFGGVGVLAARAGWGSVALLTAFLAQATLTLAIGYAATRHPIRPRLTGDRSLLGFGLQVVLTNAVNWLIENCDKYFIGRYWGAQDLGAYSVASNLARTPSGVLLGAIQPVAFSSASRVQDEAARLRNGYQDLINLTALVMFPLFALLQASADRIILLLYGDAWTAAIPLFSVMCVAVPLYALLAVTGPILWATNNVQKELRSQLAVALVLIAALFLLRDQALADVVWAIPALYLLRFGMVYRALSTTVDTDLRALAASLRGGLVLAAVASGVNHVSAHLMRQSSLIHDNALLSALLPPLVSGLLTLLVAMVLSRHLVNHRVGHALAARFARRPAATA